MLQTLLNTNPSCQDEPFQSKYGHIGNNKIMKPIYKDYSDICSHVVF